MRYPKNQLKENLYTSGGEFIEVISNRIYSGYYWEGNGRYFVGKTVNNNANELRKITSTEIEKLKISNNLPASLPSKINKNFTSLLNTNQSVSSIPPGSSTDTDRYFIKQTNVNPILIKEVNKANFEQIKNNPIYQTLILSSNTIYLSSPELNKAEITFPGITSFLFG
jgi:hypothetical protein